MISCSKENELSSYTQDSTKFYASIEVPNTRTYVDENDKVHWTAEDLITVFKGNTTPRKYQYVGNTGQKDGEFNDITSSSSATNGNVLTTNYAIYPYDENTTITDAGVITYKIPAIQKYTKNSFGLGANTMIAVTKDSDDNFLAFKNLGGYFEFSLYGDITVKSIEFWGNNNEKLAGNATIIADRNGVQEVTFANNATKTLYLDCGSGVALGTTEENATKFWFVVPAITYSNGITISITDTDGKVMTKSSYNPITIKRSSVQPLSAFLVETKGVPSNEIWYTSTEKILPRQDADFGAEITAYSWNETTGKGKITFNGNITKIGNYAFYECSTLTNISIPQNIISIGEYAFSGCISIENLSIPNGVSDIGDGAFGNCKSLKNFSIPIGVTSISKYLLYGCTSLENIIIPEGVKSIKDGAFQYCHTIESITIPSSVTTIGNLVFLNCTNLKNITLSEGITSIGYGAFGYCPIENITLPNSINSIPYGAFSACINIRQFSGKYASADGKYLSNEGELFAFATNGIKEYTIPNGITSIGNYTFQFNPNLESINIPETVNSIGIAAFSNCI